MEHDEQLRRADPAADRLGHRHLPVPPVLPHGAEELCEAARIDGASPLHFFRHVLLPLSVSNMVALSIILFLYGWNQYLWPLLFTTEKDMATAVIGLKHLIPQSDAEPAWNVAMNAALLVMLPPALVVVALQRWLVKGLVDSGK